MNIFCVDSDPVKSAQQLCNKHIIKMPLETIGMLSYAFKEDQSSYPNKRSGRHYLHPASVWARKSRENFEWLLEHGKELANEYFIRYKREHFAKTHLDWINNNYQSIDFEQAKLTNFAGCFGKLKETIEGCEIDRVKQYRLYYLLDKENFAKWPSTDKIPDWWEYDKDKYIDKSFINGFYSKR